MVSIGVPASLPARNQSVQQPHIVQPRGPAFGLRVVAGFQRVVFVQ